MVILDMAVRVDPAIRVLTLDTGRLPEQTYRMIESVRERYGIVVETVSPDGGEVERMMAEHGPNLFYRDIASRMLCCQIRKVRPLERKLREFQAYLVGLRRDQNETRATLEQIDYDAVPVKVAPLAEWTSAQVEAYTRDNDVPVHPLYAAGYSSIGCEPCTRAIAAGEEERAGRWWWEEGADKECGLHFTPDGRAQRKVDVMLEEVLAGGRG
ncbi:MAG: adenylylsulfate kinase / phosphoadenylylsulfate reductase (thioredoxin) [Bryobacterales bacterium]|nr:adenylylsulfate kinase / phosphoadenylylsulfate reductase (thioredoxin) [Bryobacterales bacterium]